MKTITIKPTIQKNKTFGLTLAMTILLGAIVAQAQTSSNDITFFSNRDGNLEIYTMRADGTNQTNITNSAGSESFPSWSPDGSRIVFVRTNGIWTMNADGTNQIQLTNVAGTDSRPNWSPDGSKIAFGRAADGAGTVNVFVMNADGSNPVQLTTAASGEDNSGPRWSPNGARIVFVSNRGAAGSDAEIYVMNANGSNQTALTDNTALDAGPDWSPDGSRIAFQSNRDGNVEIYVMNANGSNQTRITNNPTLDFLPAWSPDGTKFVFSTNRDGNDEIYTMNADGSNPIRLTFNTGIDAAARWKSSSVLTTGLNGPAKIIVAGQSSLLVAEAGTTAPNSGRVSLVNRTSGARRTLIENLPSALNSDGGAPAPAGPSGLKLVGQRLFLTVGAGDTTMPVTGGFILNPSPSSPLFNSVLELTLPADYETLSSQFALSIANQMTLNGGGQVTLTNAEGKQLTVRLVANLPDYVNEPRPALPAHIRPSNLFGIEAAGDSLYVVDASFNLLYRVNIAVGAYETFATFPYYTNPTPMGPPFVEPVPDSVRIAGGNLYVSFLSGFPFAAGVAEVRTINLATRQQATFIPNLTSAIDVLPFNGAGGANDSYLALEFSANQLAQAPGRLKLFTSHTETPRILAANLITPTSVARDPSSGGIFVTELAPGRITRVNAPKAIYRDYFGTGKSDFVRNNIFAGGNIVWSILRNPQGTPAQIRRVTFGLQTDTVLYGDFDGDLKQDIAVYREGTQSYFYFIPSTSPNTFISQAWGTTGDKPVTGDFDGDGKTDFCIVRRTNNQMVWIILPSGGGAIRYVPFGLASDRENPTAADFNGDGRDDLIVTRTEPNGDLTHYIGDASSGASVSTVQWGNNSLAPTTVFFGDYTGDSRADIAVNYGACNSNPTCENAGTWWILPTGNANYTVTKFGIPFNAQTMTGDRPTFGDWDGDGKTDISVVRPSNTTLYALTSSNGQLFSQFWNGESATP